jgi:hypothetical protein
MKRFRMSTRFLLDYYDAHLRSDKIFEIYNALGCSKAQLERWTRDNPELLEAKQLAEERRKKGQFFSEYIVGRLSPEARDCYDKISFWAAHESAASKIDKILEGKSKKLRQELFVHTLASTCFNVNEACRLTGINSAILGKWKEDFEFRTMVSEIEFAKNNFIEQGLMDLIQARHPGAVLFANKTRNRDRGYGEVVAHEHSGTIQHAALNIDELELSVECRRELLQAIRTKQTSNKLANTNLLPENTTDEPQEAELVEDAA